MSNSTNQQTLGILLERATGQRDEAQRTLQDLLNRADQARAQHGQLTQYRGEYQQRWSQQFSQTGTMDIVACYQNFRGRLDEAIHSQGHVASHADQRVSRARETLLELETRVAAITKLMERRRLEVSRAQQRQDQKTTDEQAARASMAAFNPYSRLSA
ncbi:MAG: flagellar export protein FliJ [Microbacteriaceae bacterium]|nr:flagellar export protein FliJ [Burkholderiaceae bacterium]